ncbi:two-component system response regulator [Lewinella aquimaris]|uniref:Two-component system response regulator n=1 Tax=Neolewinella aquimaris TaxID=1835722 RepID=A0A840EC50_9BACT|nr:response regulator [Neolewinella aquimaris]MBB4081037.1 two-component system response regulator [Neolewinella aquimaris]
MSTHRILLIEDDATEAKLARRTLNKIDPEIEVIRLKDGAHFLEYYSDHQPNEDVSLAIMDLHMPHLSGLQVLESLQAQGSRPSFPIVMFSSTDDASEVTRAYELGGSAFVNKPASSARYREVFQHIVNFWLSTNRIR